MSDTQHPWWKDVVVYQIYPASFKDSNDDGIGDIPGIIQSLDYIRSIGVDVIWLSPIYASPQVDMGYDVADYKSVYPPYGTVQDMDTLVTESHRRGMRLILDLVVNHTSNQHAWFQESRSSKDNTKRDWYIWRPAKYSPDGTRKPPTNWRSAFEGSAWEWDEQTQEYYLHMFTREQPDLNWDNPTTRRAIYAHAVTFWLDKGVDGFRIDTAGLYSKPPYFPDAPITDPETEFQPADSIVCNGPRVKEFLSEMCAIFARYDTMTVGECPNVSDVEMILGYVGASQKRMNMIFQLDVVEVGCGDVSRFQTAPFAYKLVDLKRAVERTQSFLANTEGWTTSFVENHDVARCVSRYADDGTQWHNRSAKLLCMLFASLSGTLFIYQGQEIGMVNIPKEWPIEEYKDVGSVNYYNAVAERSQHDPEELRKARASLQYLARDNARTPMQWTACENHAGFTSEGVTPWMRVNPSAAKGINVADQRDHEESVLGFWRQMLRVRREHADVLVHGLFELLDMENEHVFSFVKSARGGGRKALAVCNFFGKQSPLPDVAKELGRTLVMSNAGSIASTILQPWESRLYVTDSVKM